MKENLIVQKFGGTSVGSAQKIQHVANRIKTSLEKYEKVVVVVSAMGDTTDHLIDLCKQISKNPNRREYDALVSTGEMVSASLLAMALQELDIQALSLTGSQAGIFTEDSHSKAKILSVDTKRMNEELEANDVLVVTGFQGINSNNDVTTIGRGGSDTSAVVIAAALKCPTCEIYTDVNGVYTTDPRLVKNARKMETIAYDEMLELASLGAKVLHPRSVECAKAHGITLHVRSTFETGNGTLVKEGKMEIEKPVTGACVIKNEAIVSILKVQDKPGVASSLFEKLAKANINVDMIIQSTQENQINNITFTVTEDELEQAIGITQEVADEVGASGVTSDNNVAKLSIVGVGMISKPGVAAKFFQTLGDHGVNIKLISTSEIKISCAIDREKADEALNQVHKAFNLDKL